MPKTNSCAQNNHAACGGVGEMKGTVEVVARDEATHTAYCRQGIIGFTLCECECHADSPIDTTADAPPGYRKLDKEFVRV